ncbi:exonuclease mut-7-like protein isoform X1 [Senna tora]|uniref:Exonuclease mut-7-like protein isoform X1 n=1 Tax=Senna tora TaxID=362788 RepID=A0A834SK26_9FABA|nr:exonuclease mut-7-like protein isoform X1 [Senna tora]
MFSLLTVEHRTIVASKRRKQQLWQLPHREKIRCAPTSKNLTVAAAASPQEATEIDGEKDHASTLCVHAFSDLTRVSPVVFVYLLKESYFCGTFKASAKFRVLQHQVSLVLHNDPKPGPASFVIQCLYVSPLFEDCSRGFSHLIISALVRFLKKETTSEDSLTAKHLAAHLFIDIVVGQVCHDEKIVVKILETFDVKLTDIEEVMFQLKKNDGAMCGTAQKFIEKYIFELVESQLYMTAVTLIERFSTCHFGKPFLLSMVQSNQFKAAEKWATLMGKPMLCTLVEEYNERNLLKNAYEIIKTNNLQEDFPDIYRKCKERQFAYTSEKGCWDVAEAKAKSDRHLIEYLVYLAMEAGYTEKVDELCDRYSLEEILIKGMPIINLPDKSVQHRQYLHLDELFIEDIIWVDENKGLLDATSHIEGYEVVGVDSEWKPNHVKGSSPNKVSILQIASGRRVYVFDLIKLNQEVPDILDDCLTRILQSPTILKLGYDILCDIKQLAHSYEKLKCFKNFESLLDLQNLFKDPRGGLSGLAEKVLGAGLNKTRRNSDWEQRPLTQYQLEYAALDAAVLIQIFSHLPGEGHEKLEWKSRTKKSQNKEEVDGIQIKKVAVDKHEVLYLPSQKLVAAITAK